MRFGGFFMGTYVNPGNEAFNIITNSGYVDKTGLIDLINKRINTPNSLTCLSRARRFGKSYAAKMLAAYYDCSCDSHALFDNRKIAKSPDYERHLNQYNVICLDITGFISAARRQNISLQEVPNMIVKALSDELMDMGFDVLPDKPLTDNILRVVGGECGKKFIFIIDEWDAMIREAKDDSLAQKKYLDLLREWFKNGTFTPKAIAAAYMTGILPIKKDGSQSAISDFKEYTMLEPGEFAGHFGFTEDEVRKICNERDLDFECARSWYDGYTLGDQTSIYNPYSVMEAAEHHKFKSYWKKTSAAESLQTYIDMDEDGLQSDIVALISGQTIEVDTESFQNDFESFRSKDDVLTLLIHLGYLTYIEDDDSGYAVIPNEEVRREFEQLIHKAKHVELMKLIKKSDELLEFTLAGNCDAVAKIIEAQHESSFSPTYYNDEQSLRYTIKMAYITCVDQYARVEELPSGHGLADVVYIPKKRSGLPALVIELKWNKSDAGAIAQIKSRNYSGLPAKIVGEVVLVGINYDEKSKLHTCTIERVYMN